MDRIYDGHLDGQRKTLVVQGDTERYRLTNIQQAAQNIMQEYISAEDIIRLEAIDEAMGRPRRAAWYQLLHSPTEALLRCTTGHLTAHVNNKTLGASLCPALPGEA